MKALLICNIGTPTAPDTASVKTYLQEFLMDKNILTMPWFVRYPLVHWFITPRRAQQSAQKYQAVWMDKGSPLLVYTEDLVNELKRLLPKDILIEIGMRYSEPSLDFALQKFSQKKITDVFVVPMFPQFAQATTGSLMEKISDLNSKYQMKIHELKPFYGDDFFLDSFAGIIQTQLKPDHFLLFSYHGLPESALQSLNASCLQTSECCQQPAACANNCYRAQCLKTTELLAKRLALQPDQYALSFQSRVGPKKWIKPYTEETLIQLAKSGQKKIAVVCPSFTSDCIETLEEIGIEGRQTFQKHGGESFQLISCLNAHSIWSERLAEQLKRQFQL